MNQRLMTLFFLVVGLEAKRELDLGGLRECTRVGVPLVAALGGMAMAAALYLAINSGGPGVRRWSPSTPLIAHAGRLNAPLAKDRP